MPGTRALGEENEASVGLGKLYFTIKYSFEKTALIVTVNKCNNPPAKDSSANTSDPYVKLQLLPEKQHKVKTRVLRRTTNPVYDEDFTFYGVNFNQLPVMLISLLASRDGDGVTTLLHKAEEKQRLLSADPDSALRGPEFRPVQPGRRDRGGDGRDGEPGAEGHRDLPAVACQGDRASQHEGNPHSMEIRGGRNGREHTRHLYCVSS